MDTPYFLGEEGCFNHPLCKCSLSSSQDSAYGNVFSSFETQFFSGPWDDKSSHILIQLLREYPEAYFILGKNCKRTEAWELIRYKLGEAGYQFTVLQVRLGKFHNILNRCVNDYK